MEETKKHFIKMLNEISNYRQSIEDKLTGLPYDLILKISEDETLAWNHKEKRIHYFGPTMNRRIVECPTKIRIDVHKHLHKFESLCEEKMKEIMNKFYEKKEI